MSKETSMDDAELDSLMAELETQIEGAVAQPAQPKKVDTPPAPIPEPEPQPVEPPPAPKPKPVVAPPAVVTPIKAAEPVATPAPAPANVVEIASTPRKAPALQYVVDPVQFGKDTRVTETTLDACMIEQNSHRAFYGAQAANAEAQASRMKVRFEVVEAQLYDVHRKALTASGEKVTEKAVENAVKLDPKWASIKNALIEAETIAAINKALVESLKDRCTMIVQLGADRRDETKGQVRTMLREQERDDLRQRALAAAQR